MNYKFRIWDSELNKWASVKNLLLTRIGENTFYSLPTEDTKRFVLQLFTGLTDKNGKEIYEGDIIKSSRGNYYYKNFIADVKYSTYSGGFYANILVSLGENINLLQDDSHKIEVVGNIFENPNLLK